MAKSSRDQEEQRKEGITEKGYLYALDNAKVRSVNSMNKYWEERDKYINGLQDNVNSAFYNMQNHYKNEPEAYQPSEYQKMADDTLAQYLGRGPFTYDIAQDALYQQAKENYIQQGNLAMMDTMGQAAAMTGGYNNSYAQTVGQQVYNQYLGQLNDMVPDMYAAARKRYDQEGEDILGRYSIYAGLEAQNLQNYQNKYAQWASTGQGLTDAYNTALSGYQSATTYEKPSDEMIEKIKKDFSDAKTAEDIWDVMNQYQALGYSPQWLRTLAVERDLGIYG